MKILSEEKKTEPENCPYIEGETSVNSYFLAHEVSPKKLDELLEQGWRKFGPTYFRPTCPKCHACTPIRVLVNDYLPSKSHRKILKKNEDIEVEFKPLVFRHEIFQIYKKHSLIRFDQEVNLDEFLYTHFFPSTKGIQSEYSLNGKLIAVGFLDISEKSLNSVYFIFDPEFSKRSLGIFGAIKEIEYAKGLNLIRYYLGYYIESNPSMNYKNQFNPHEFLQWNSGTWLKQ